jgi:UDP:flavonoid glycosyltransferase YjiC (YdhE family)
LRHRALTARALADAMHTLVSVPAFQRTATAIAARLHGEDGVQVAVNVIESLVASRAS